MIASGFCSTTRMTTFITSITLRERNGTPRRFSTPSDGTVTRSLPMLNSTREASATEVVMMSSSEAMRQRTMTSAAPPTREAKLATKKVAGLSAIAASPA